MKYEWEEGLPLLPSEFRRYKEFNEFIIAGIYEYPEKHIYYVKIPLTDIPNSMVTKVDCYILGL